MKTLKTIIIDDEANARQTLRNMITMLSPEVEILGEAKNVEEGLELIETLKPNLIFLDIQMPGRTGFDLISSIEKPQFDVIFTTAHQEYALKAFRFSAIDYLLKPIDPDELLEAINKSKIKSEPIDKQQVTLLDETLLEYGVRLHKRKPNGNKRLALNSSEGIHFVPLSEIICCEAMGSYTKFHLINKKKIVVSKVLKEYEDILHDYYFCRVHQSSIVNLDHIIKYVKGDGGQVWLSDNSEIEVSRRRKAEFLELLSEFYVNSSKIG
jgi:two-component system, LytTR family, response regulator